MGPWASLVNHILQNIFFCVQQIWNNLRVSKCWQNFHFWLYYPFKFFWSTMYARRIYPLWNSQNSQPLPTVCCSLTGISLFLKGPDFFEFLSSAQSNIAMATEMSHPTCMMLIGRDLGTALWVCGRGSACAPWKIFATAHPSNVYKTLDEAELWYFRKVKLTSFCGFRAT